MTEPRSGDEIVSTYKWLAASYTLAASLIWGVNTLFLLDAGLSIGEVFFINAVFSVGMALFEVPTGVFADTKGRRWSFLLSTAVLGAGSLAYMALAHLASPLWLWALVSAVLGVGYTFYSGATEAWLVDALQVVEYDGKLEDVFAATAMLSSAMMLLGTLGGGLLAQLHLSLPYLLRGLLLFVVFGMAWVKMFDQGFEPLDVPVRELPREMGRIAKASLRYGWERVEARLLILASGAQGIFMMWGFYAAQAYFLDLLGRDLPWVAAAVTALLSIASMLGNWTVRQVRGRFERRTSILLFCAAASSACAVLTGVFVSFYAAVAVYLLGTFFGGMFGPVKQAFLHAVVPSKQRASVISFDSLVFSGAGGLGQWGLGALSDLHGLGAGYRIGGALSALALPALARLRVFGGEADRTGDQGPAGAGKIGKMDA